MTCILVIAAFLPGILAVWLGFRYGAAIGVTVFPRFFPGLVSAGGDCCALNLDVSSRFRLYRPLPGRDLRRPTVFAWMKPAPCHAAANSPGLVP